MEPKQIRWFLMKYGGQGFLVSELAWERMREYFILKHKNYPGNIQRCESKYPTLPLFDINNKKERLNKRCQDCQGGKMSVIGRLTIIGNICLLCSLSWVDSGTRRVVGCWQGQ